MRLPESIFSRWFRQRRKVLLPEPDGPIITRSSPRPTVRDTFCRTCRSPNHLSTSRASTTAVDAAAEPGTGWNGIGLIVSGRCRDRAETRLDVKSPGAPDQYVRNRISARLDHFFRLPSAIGDRITLDAPGMPLRLREFHPRASDRRPRARGSTRRPTPPSSQAPSAGAPQPIGEARADRARRCEGAGPQ